MAIYSYDGMEPSIGEDCFVADGARLIGRVFMEPGANIWYNCVLRGDVNQIYIGENTNVQDLSMLHVTEQNPLKVGNNVTIAHNVSLHGCTIEDHALIGIGAVVLDRTVIGHNSIVAAGSVVPPNKVFPPYSMIMGTPARVVRELTGKEKTMLENHYKSYLKYAKDFMDETKVRRLDNF